jgi:probable phosphoglycerate mutase
MPDMNLLLIRHGETTLNVARVLQPADTPLSTRGFAQAAALAGRLEHAGLAGILCSDLLRARQTAEPLAAVTGLPVVYSALLQERNFGDLRGLAYDTLPFDPMQLDDAPPGGESSAVFLARVAAAFAEAVAVQAQLQGPLAVVTHGLVVKAMLSQHVQHAPGGVTPARLANASLSIIDAAAPHPVLLMDCTRHLGPELCEPRGSLSGG